MDAALALPRCTQRPKLGETLRFFGLLSGVYPAWRMSRLHPVAALKGASR